ncbi:MAG: hypothetical protein IJN04_06320 [Clostridia bacterium]|nr:hypothetical protein [Clostridia bacterium]
MKKVFAVILALVLTLTLSVTVCAAPGQFVNSPSNNGAPTLISVEKGNEDCTATLIITPYIERDTLPAELKTLIERAYGEIAASKDLTELNADLAALAALQKIDGPDLKVSDLFDIRYEGCREHDETHTFTINLKADTLHRFVGLLHMNLKGEWELIENAKVINGGEALQFTISDMSPFAIVVDTSEAGGDSPVTGIANDIAIYGILMLLSAVAIAVLVVKSKKYA